MRGHTPYHARDSREHDPRPSGHHSCILMRHGLRSQGFDSMKMHATHEWRPRPYHVKVKGLSDWELRRVTLLVVWTLLNPHIWFDTPNQAMQCMLCKHGSKMQHITKKARHAKCNATYHGKHTMFLKCNLQCNSSRNANMVQCSHAIRGNKSNIQPCPRRDLDWNGRP